MDTTQSDQRKFRCLVAALTKAGIHSMEGVLAKPELVAGYDFQSVYSAVEMSRRKNAPKWTRAVERIMRGSDKWTPGTVAEWVEFEKAREQICGCASVLRGHTGIVWSPVEAWMVAYKDDTWHLMSLLTGEAYYACLDMSGNRLFVEAGLSNDMPKMRSITSTTISSTTVRAVRNMDQQLKPATTLIQNIIENSVFS